MMREKSQSWNTYYNFVRFCVSIFYFGFCFLNLVNISKFGSLTMQLDKDKRKMNCSSKVYKLELSLQLGHNSLLYYFFSLFYVWFHFCTCNHQCLHDVC